MGLPKGDFLGFTFNNIHSSQLGILRVSNGSRLNESLLPTMQDKVVQVPGGDGSYYFGSYYTQRNFVVSFAFDCVTESELRQMKALFGDKKIHDLIFDEIPYKTYQAKVTGMATINYVCFDEGPTHRLYKGEGEIQFTAFQPYAITKKKYLDQYDCKNKNEWAQSSGLLERKGIYDAYNGDNILLYNPGDKDSDWTLKINFKSFDGKTYIPRIKIFMEQEGLELDKITAPLTGINFQQPDQFIKINSKTNLIEGYIKRGKEEIKTGTIYNSYILSGTFFKIPCNSYDDLGKIIDKRMILDLVESDKDCLQSDCLSYNYYFL